MDREQSFVGEFLNDKVLFWFLLVLELKRQTARRKDDTLDNLFTQRSTVAGTSCLVPGSCS